MKHQSFIVVILAILGILCIPGLAAAAGNLTPAALPAGTVLAPSTDAIGPTSPLYGFKIALENFDESFTPNQTEKLEKEINRTDLRLAELQGALAANQTDAVNRTLDQYWQKVNQSEETITTITNRDGPDTTAPNGSTWQPQNNGTGLMLALENLNRHQETFRYLMQEYPNNTGLVRAYNNSLERQLRFEEKIRERTWSGDTAGYPGANTTGTGSLVPSKLPVRGQQDPTGNGTAKGIVSPDTGRSPGQPGEGNQSAQSADGTGQISPGNRGGDTNDQSQSGTAGGTDKGSPDTVGTRETNQGNGQGNGNTHVNPEATDNGNGRPHGR
ncbi:DUF5667 domain-containing protein [Methanoregula sp. UBA64]|jgi:hypothetical protein|uniref:DUF5667 domain-containing protein n=1 Tax=Methanoregula sp. UBA64 TaxID=1915554 RepID=UPI0025F18D15|nr:DUF5667 domain-containing protein [Methanoregula sp. UBA64]